MADTTPRELFSDVERVRAAGLEVPQITALMHLLKQHGLPVPGDVITVEEGLEVLTALLRKNEVESCR